LLSTLSGSESGSNWFEIDAILLHIYTREELAVMEGWDILYANHNTLGQLTNQSQGILYFGKRGFIEIGVSDLARLGREVL